MNLTDADIARIAERLINPVADAVAAKLQGEPIRKRNGVTPEEDQEILMMVREDIAKREAKRQGV